MTVAPSVFYTEPSRWFMEQLLNMVPGTENGGIYANKPGYHNTRNQNLPTNYSVVLPPDKLGPGTKAAAYDWTFPEAQSGDYSRISVYSSRLRGAGQANDPRTDGWREFYGQADTDTEVEGWDFYYNRAVSSDTSHLWHIHLSELRKFTEDLRNKQAMLSILSGQSLADWLGVGPSPTEEDSMHRVRSGGGDLSIYLVPGYASPSGRMAAFGLDGPRDATYASLPLYQLPPGVTVDGSGYYDVTPEAWPTGGGKGDGASPEEVRVVVREELDKTTLGS